MKLIIFWPITVEILIVYSLPRIEWNQWKANQKREWNWKWSSLVDCGSFDWINLWVMGQRPSPQHDSAPLIPTNQFHFTCFGWIVLCCSAERRRASLFSFLFISYSSLDVLFSLLINESEFNEAKKKWRIAHNPLKWIDMNWLHW